MSIDPDRTRAAPERSSRSYEKCVNSHSDPQRSPCIPGATERAARERFVTVPNATFGRRGVSPLDDTESPCGDSVRTL
jgi:hypothetical protein